MASRVELRRDFCDCTYADIEWEQGIHTAYEGIERQGAVRVEGSNLAPGVHAGISASGQRHPNRFACKSVESPFECALNGRCVGLQLGARVGGSLVFDEEG